MTHDPTLEERIARWREHLHRRQGAKDAELEVHLRSQFAALGEAGLDQEEVFLVAVKRLGKLDPRSRELSGEYSERLWKQLVVSPASGTSSATAGRETAMAIGLAAAAGVALKAPELFGLHLAGPNPAAPFYARNLGLLVLPFLAGFFALQRGMPRSGWFWLAASWIAAGLLANVPPFQPKGDTGLLAAIHLPIALWLTVGFAYAGGRWCSHDQRMNFVRFSGEWFIYYTLMALGGGALAGITMFIFHAIGLNAMPPLEQWVIPCGAAGAVVIAAWLVELKQGVVENMAPVLTVLFTPLFAVLLLIFVATMAWTGHGIDVGREVFIGFDLLLVLVLCLLLYAISARNSQAPPGRFDLLQLVLVACALVVDVLALWAMATRISEFGFSPNKTAALGMNLLLLVNLGWSAVLYARFLAKRSPFTALERWQTAYLPAYAVWAWFVVALFPVIFHYR